MEDMGGTSLATPVVAGLMALVAEAWQENLGEYPASQEFRDLVMSTSDDRGMNLSLKAEGGSMHQRQYGHWMGITGVGGPPLLTGTVAHFRANTG